MSTNCLLDYVMNCLEALFFVLLSSPCAIKYQDKATPFQFLDLGVKIKIREREY